MNAHPDLVSIIVPAHNAGAFIGEALSSIAAQSHAHWELIVVEDGTNDGTEALLAKFSEKFGAQHRIVFHRHPTNRGVGPTRNTAMALSRGEYLAFLDHDDHWKPEHLSLALAPLRANQADLAYSTAVMFDSETGQPFNQWGPTKEDLEDFARGLYLRNFILPSAVVMKRRVYEAVGNFDERPEIQSCEDHDYWLRAAEKRFGFFHVPQQTCWYRKNNGAAATSNVVRMLERSITVLNKHHDFSLIADKDRRYCRSVNLALLAEISLAQSKRKGIRLLLQAWLEQPKNWRRLRRLASAIWKGAAPSA